MPSRSLSLCALVAVALLTLTACGATTPSVDSPATVSGVVDGDTLTLAGGERVRLVQIDAPERGQECHAAAATRELQKLTPPGSRVELEADPRLDSLDRFGRLLRYVFVGGTNVNVELVRRGAATPWFFQGERGRYAARLLVAVGAARAARRGMWGDCRVSWRPDRQVETRSR